MSAWKKPRTISSLQEAAQYAYPVQEVPRPRRGHGALSALLSRLRRHEGKILLVAREERSEDPVATRRLKRRYGAWKVRLRDAGAEAAIRTVDENGKIFIVLYASWRPK